MDYKGQSDEELVALFAGGDQEALQVIAVRYRNKVLQFVLWLSGPGNAEDLTQDVFVELFRSAKSFKGDSSFRTWLYGIARNVCRRHQRAQKFKRILFSAGTTIDRIQDEVASPYEQARQVETSMYLDKAIGSLSPGQRVTLLLRVWEGLSYEAIATVLQVPVGTVRSRLHHARAKLAKKLARDPEK
jgi:RNA polymerase sigma-70 factor (ECF subfamily)